MADDYVDKIAGELADLALADERRSDDEKIVNVLSDIVGASAQTLQEAFLTAVRVRRAERRARQLLADRAAEQVVSNTHLLTDKRDDEDYKEHRQPRTSFERERNDTAPTSDNGSVENTAVDDLADDAQTGDDAGASKVKPSRTKRR
jgi:hypothetical protein